MQFVFPVLFMVFRLGDGPTICPLAVHSLCALL